MMPIALAALFATIGGSAPAQPVILFSSQAIEVARNAATEQSHAPLPTSAAFDIPEQSTKLQSGYFRVNYYTGVRIRMTVWINLTTGQVVEPDLCLYFHGPKVHAFSASVRKKTHAYPIALDKLARDVGCDSLNPA